MSIKLTSLERLIKLKNKIDAKTEKPSNTLSESVDNVIAGYGQGGGEDEFYNTVTEGGTNFRYLFYERSDLKVAPKLDTSKGTKFDYMHYKNTSLEELPNYDYSSVDVNMESAFYGCTQLLNQPSLNIPDRKISIQSLFYGCTKMKHAAGVVFDYTGAGVTGYTQTNKAIYSGCTSLQTVNCVRLMNTNWECKEIFYNCTSLEEVGEFSTKGQYIDSIFSGCSKLHTIGKLSIPTSRGWGSTFKGCTSLENVYEIGDIRSSVSLTECINLTKDTAKRFAIALMDYSGTTNEHKFTISYPSNVLEDLLADGNTAPNDMTWDEYIDSKGWLYQ